MFVKNISFGFKEKVRSSVQKPREQYGYTKVTADTFTKKNLQNDKDNRINIEDKFMSNKNIEVVEKVKKRMRSLPLSLSGIVALYIPFVQGDLKSDSYCSKFFELYMGLQKGLIGSEYESSYRKNFAPELKLLDSVRYACHTYTNEDKDDKALKARVAQRYDDYLNMQLPERNISMF